MTSVLSATIRERAASHARARWGLSFPESRRVVLEQAFVRACVELDVSPEVAAARLGHDPVFERALLADLTVPEGYFFRDPEHYEHVRARMQAARGHVRLWSAGCASGEEPYSLAILALEVFGDQAARRVDVIASDLNHVHLACAREGVFRPWSFRSVGAEFIDRYFRPDEGGLAIVPAVRSLVRFVESNLMEPDDPATPIGCDVILCRNVLIYFAEEDCVRALAGLRDHLAPEGIIIVGPADPAVAVPGMVRTVRGGVTCYALGESPAPHPSVPSPTPVPASPSPSPSPSPAPPRPMFAASAGPVAPGPKPVAASSLPTADAFVARARQHFDEGRHRAAIEDARRAALLDPDLPAAHLLRACAHLACSEHDAARTALRRARRAANGRDPASADPRAAEYAAMARALSLVLGVEST